MDNTSYHIPVMLEACIQGLNIRPNGIYLDLTFGGGGHSRAILAHLEEGHLYGFDQDSDAVANVPDDDRFTFVQANFRDLKRYLKLYDVFEVDGILADLGISSHQIDEPERGFSTRFDADLDMRMNQSGDITAAIILNTYDENELHKLFGQFGEVKNAKSLARAIVSERANKPIQTVEHLKSLLEKFAPRGKQFKYFAQVFQALRIVVNDELGALKDMLEQSAELLKPGGRLVVMSYHSLEDRLVKNFIQKGKFHGEVEKDFYGNIQRPLDPVTRKAVTADEAEVKANSRARSAKLRIAKKI
ncbi:MAG: 16S rRNA (cytosine(1402)-N(4))-methyltransferase RsmH [Lunatimonas sp.]|uniref:16S rRNA (cytosine(1402)-N(4))-methyltransferase RsmH n=1 Tax=Lunatimonas sp. TaxID=2060141 RepID=UPI00263A9E1B|nr:16S rRNA (cytosine(1402)-N(4))-methyltransferase RsmH [Lunatimonas sp.]MCC5936213.1 16S rRNA (cytosine(1402)-N(4))-methyltransferase RsmH [Lunatimonas sp.]